MSYHDANICRLQYLSLPSWIQSSRLCISQLEDINEDIHDKTTFVECPVIFSNFSLNIATLDDFIRLANTLQYWEVDSYQIPYELYDFILIPRKSNIIDEVNLRLQDDLPILIQFRELVDLFLLHLSNIRQYFSFDNSSKYIDAAILQCAVVMNRSDLLQYVVNHKCFSLKNDLSRLNAVSLAMLACRYGSLEVLTMLTPAEYFLSAGCLRVTQYCGHTACTDYLMSHDCPWRDATDSEKSLFLDKCVTIDKLTIDKLQDILNQTNIDVNVVALDEQASGETALHNAVMRMDIDAITLLLDHCADVNRRNDLGMTPLYHAAKLGSLEVIELLLQRGAHINIPSINMESPLFIASANNEASVVKYLLSKGADVDTLTDSGNNALLAAADAGYYQITNLLLNNRARLNDLAMDSWIGIYAAAYFGDEQRVKDLIHHFGSRVNVTNKKLQTPLYAAVCSENTQAVQILINNDADVNALTSSNDTALKYAIRSKNMALVKSLLSINKQQGSNRDTTSFEGNPYYPEIRQHLDSYVSETRRWLHNDVFSWFTDISNTRQVFWLKAGAGN